MGASQVKHCSACGAVAEIGNFDVTGAATACPHRPDAEAAQDQHPARARGEIISISSAPPQDCYEVEALDDTARKPIARQLSSQSLQSAQSNRSSVTFKLPDDDDCHTKRNSGKLPGRLSNFGGVRFEVPGSSKDITANTDTDSLPSSLLRRSTRALTRPLARTIGRKGTKTSLFSGDSESRAGSVRNSNTASMRDGPDAMSDSRSFVSSFSDLARSFTPEVDESVNKRRLLGKLSSDSLGEATCEVITFKEQKYLRRGSRVNEVLRSCAVIFASSTGSAETYAMSEEVADISMFISHNWVVPRIKKYLCLCMCFNFYPAFIAALTIMVAIGARVLPLFEGSDGRLYCPWAKLLVCPVFVLVLCFWHELLRSIGVGGPAVFLDKTCIHQVDKRLQKEGISKLGAFIRSSNRMLIIYSDVYLTKLWTVYEVACFLAQHSPKNLVIIPTYSPIAVLGWLLVFYLGALLRLVFQVSDYEEDSQEFADRAEWLVNAAIFIASFILAGGLRHAARQKHMIYKRLENFDVAECACFCEQDRPVVYKNIAIMCREVGDVEEDADDMKALDAFNHVVRTYLTASLLQSIGPFGLQYSHVVAVFMCTIQGIDDLAVLEPGHHLKRLILIMHYSCWVLGVYPLMAFGLYIWCGVGLDRFTGYTEWAFVGLGPALGLALAVAVARGLWLVKQAALSGSTAGLLGLFSCLLVMAMLARLVYSKQKAPTWGNRDQSGRRRLSLPEEGRMARLLRITGVQKTESEEEDDAREACEASAGLGSGEAPPSSEELEVAPPQVRGGQGDGCVSPGECAQLHL